MQLSLFSIRDSRANCYTNPFFMPSKGAAIRAFGDEVSNQKSLLSQHPSDFALYEHGTFDDETGVFFAFLEPVLLSSASDFAAVGVKAAAGV